MWEDLRNLLDENVKECWRCGLDLKNVEMKGKSDPEIKCPRCGFIVEVNSSKNRLLTLIFAIGILAGMLGFIVRSIL